MGQSRGVHGDEDVGNGLEQRLSPPVQDRVDSSASARPLHNPALRGDVKSASSPGDPMGNGGLGFVPLCFILR